MADKLMTQEELRKQRTPTALSLCAKTSQAAPKHGLPGRKARKVSAFSPSPRRNHRDDSLQGTGQEEKRAVQFP